MAQTAEDRLLAARWARLQRKRLEEALEEHLDVYEVVQSHLKAALASEAAAALGLKGRKTLQPT
jgi:hypothetical protein